MYSITFQHDKEGHKDVILHHIDAGQSLLEVAIDHSIAINHECGGMCSCGTCHIFVMKGNEFVEFKSKREFHQLTKVQGSNQYSRLACQCILLPGEGDLTLNFSIFPI